MWILKTILAACLVTILIGCGTPPSGEKFAGIETARPDRALVYVYRPDVFYGKAVTFPVLLDEKKIADIGRNGFFPIQVNPGTHSIRTETSAIDHDLSLDFEAATTTFLRLKVNLKPAICACTSLQFESIDETTAKLEMEVMREEVDRVSYEE